MGVEQPAVPMDRLRPILDRHLKENNESLSAFAVRAGVDQVVVSRIMNEDMLSTTQSKGKRIEYKQTQVSFTTADRIITKGLGNPYLWHTHFPDIYSQKIGTNLQDKEILRGAAA